MDRPEYCFDLSVAGMPLGDTIAFDETSEPWCIERSPRYEEVIIVRPGEKADRLRQIPAGILGRIQHEDLEQDIRVTSVEPTEEGGVRLAYIPTDFPRKVER